MQGNNRQTFAAEKVPNSSHATSSISKEKPDATDLFNIGPDMCIHDEMEATCHQQQNRDQVDILNTHLCSCHISRHTTETSTAQQALVDKVAANLVSHNNITHDVTYSEHKTGQQPAQNSCSKDVLICMLLDCCLMRQLPFKCSP